MILFKQNKSKQQKDECSSKIVYIHYAYYTINDAYRRNLETKKKKETKAERQDKKNYDQYIERKCLHDNYKEIYSRSNQLLQSHE